MSKAIYLFKEHENFQPGKTKLQKKAVFTTNFYWLMAGLIFCLVLFWIGGYSLRLLWRYSQTGASTQGIVLSCQERNSNSDVNVVYQYSVNGQSYQSLASGSSRSCNDYPIASSVKIAYLADAPQVSGVEVIMNASDGFGFCVFAYIGLALLFFIFTQILKNRRDHQRYTCFQNAEIVLTAWVTGVSLQRNAKYIYYRFNRPEDLRIIEDCLEYFWSSGTLSPWPKGVKEGDTLQILYVDSEIYCVL